MNHGEHGYMYEDENGDEQLVDLPGEYEVCDLCRGTGKMTNRSIGAITSDEWERDWDYEEREAYMNGRYDVLCDECNGKRVVWGIDLEAFEKLNKEAYDHYVNKMRYDAEDRAAWRLENGGYDY